MNMMQRCLLSAFSVLLPSLLVPMLSTPVGAQEEPQAAVAGAVERVRQFIRAEMEAKQVPGLSIAVADRGGILWAEGLGLAVPARKAPATAETIYRVASVSKPFTAVALMRRVERGELDLDKPVTMYLPGFRVGGPPGKPITLRHLLSHRSGLPWEPPRGGYFIASPPPLDEIVRSLADAEPTCEPGTRYRYSNAGFTVAGQVLAGRAGRGFADAMKAGVLDPLELRHSTFDPMAVDRAMLATGTMWTLDGRSFDAPTFPLGIAPAGGLYSSAGDLARFASGLLRCWSGRDASILRRETLEAMWTPQFVPAGEAKGYGLGFAIGQLDGRRRIGHGGALYGFSTELALVPDLDLAVAVSANMDLVGSVSRRVADFALTAFAAARGGGPMPEVRTTAPLPTGVARQLAGRYEEAGTRLDLNDLDGALFADRGIFRVEVRADGDRLRLDGRLGYGDTIEPLEGGKLRWNDRILTRIPDREHPAAPARWDGLIGEYGPDEFTLYILEKDASLHVLIEWFYDCPLSEIQPTIFAFPADGPYGGEKLVFTMGPNGRATSVRAGGFDFARRPVGTSSGTFRIRPVRPVRELEAEALKASPPHEDLPGDPPPLVDLRSLDPTIKLDIRYATANNFLGEPLYRSPRAFLRRPAAESLVRVQGALRPLGLGLLIHDAYRPWYVTRIFWDATPLEQHDFVADPSKGSRHNRGAAVDLTLYDLATGEPVEMVSGYDEFSPRAFPGYPGGTTRGRRHRDVLRRAMEDQGFRVYQFEWWHFDYQGWEKFPIANHTFEAIPEAR
ncbi:serine hydrolase [Aquisphaera insulae]|uniref:serine hydrolase n=1 Tax=Aquisphaera insulae TaxID=2712864 RepID=UPI0013EBEC1F|nr:serine hydrolase [Aquisphaera insulae]